jgi:class 3 adenylate cyclase/tetratricopeptide (TPR) repeat protein
MDIHPPDEIRTVTCLFADVVESTAMAARLGLESVKAVMDRVFDRLYQVILLHGGTVDKYIGDCVMALFGAPLAFGDDPARAVRAGLAIQQAIVEVGDELVGRGLPAVKLRVGINTGPVIAGALGAGPERRYTVIGHAVNLAAHLQQAAPIGGVVMGPETFRRVRGLFHVEELEGEWGLAYRAIGERSGGLWLRPREVLGREVETVGRAGEMRELLAAVKDSFDTPRASLLLVSGEPGIGKSRLLFELLSRLEQERPEALRIVGFAHPLSAGVPFSVAAEALRRGLGISSHDAPLVAMTKLHSFLQSHSRPSLGADEQILARILQVPGWPSLREDEPALPPRRALDLLADIAGWLTERHPILLVAEDLHWCDSSTLELIDHVLERLADRPVLVLGLTRPELLHERPELLDGPNRRRLDLGPLDRQAIAQLLDQAVGTGTAERLLPVVSELSGGSPYHVEELLRSLEERHVLVRRIGGWDLHELPSALAIPPGIEALTQARIDNLSAAQRRLLCQAAVAGRTFWDGLVHELAGEEFTAQDLSTLVRRELVLPKQDSSVRGNIEYSFVHDLTRDVAYRMLPEPRRAELHRQVASWMMRQGAVSPEELAQVARHLDLGGQPDDAAGYLTQAGEAAFAASAYLTAITHYGRALELLRSPKRRFDLLGRRERVLNALGRWPEQRQDAEEMLRIAETLDGDERRVEALIRLGRARLNVGELEEARAAFRTAYQRSVDTDDGDGQARSLRWLAMYHFNRSEHLQARVFFEQALQVAERHENKGLAAELGYELGVTAGTIGDYTRALEVSRRALQSFREQRNHYQEAFCLGNIGCFHIYLGEYTEAERALGEAVELGRQLGMPLAEASAKANLGNAYRLAGRPLEALALEEEAGQVAERIGDPRLAADALVYGSLAALEAGRADEAGQLAREAVLRSRRAEMPGTEASALMALARVLGEAEGRLPEAMAAADESLALLDRIGSVEGFEQEILLVHAELCRRLDRPEEAARGRRRATEELQRKAAFIVPEERRRRFLDRFEASEPVGSRVEEPHGA